MRALLLSMVLSMLAACHGHRGSSTPAAKPVVQSAVSLGPAYTELKAGEAPQLELVLQYDRPLEGDPGTRVDLHWGRLVPRTWKEITNTPMTFARADGSRGVFTVRVAGLPPSTYEFVAHVLDTDLWVHVSEQQPNGRFELQIDPAADARVEVIRRARSFVPPAGAPASGDMVRLDAGCFQMGYVAGDVDERPVHRVCLSSFSIDRDEVTQGAYQACVAAGACRKLEAARDEAPVDSPQLPVVQVTWTDAEAYCRAQKKRLPTEAEWEYAVRGADGRLYAWGNEPSCQAANFAGFPALTACEGKHWCSADRSCERINPGHRQPVGERKLDVTPTGIRGMSGNVAEWTSDWYDEGYYARSPEKDPKGPAEGEKHVVRGGSWKYNFFVARATFRSGFRLPTAEDFFGFRCVRSE